MRQRDKSDLPLPVLSYKYFLLWYSFSILSFYRPKSTFTAAAPLEDSKNFNEGLLHQSPNSSILFLARKWPSTSSCLRSVHYPSFPHLYCILVHPQFFLLNTSFSFCSFFYPQNFLDLADEIVIPTDQPHL